MRLNVLTKNSAFVTLFYSRLNPPEQRFCRAWQTKTKK